LREIQRSLQQWLQDLGAWGPLLFIVLYAAATVMFFPGSVFTLVAGAAFGLWLAFVLVSIASTLGASLAFLLARYVARGKVEQLASRYPRFSAIDAAISEGGWKIVALLRLSPAIPFNAQNYLYGLTDIPFRHYVLASWIAMMPGTFLYVYLGHIAGAAAADRGRSVWEWTLLGLGLAATAAVAVYITRLAQRQLRRQGVAMPAEGNASADEPATVTTMPVLALAAAAILLLVAAIAAQFHTREIQQWLRPWM
jgi:uncharacterized membrane protein YdjX (TVP38/TMEM64 family)